MFEVVSVVYYFEWIILRVVIIHEIFPVITVTVIFDKFLISNTDSNPEDKMICIHPIRIHNFGWIELRILLMYK